MASTSPERTDAEQEQLNRQLNELLQELRVAMPGVQILFGFLLAVPFNQRFAQVTDVQRDIYLGTLICAALAAAAFIAPTAFHRIMFQRHNKPQLIAMATRLAIVGLAFLALAMTGAVVLVTDFLFSAATAAVVGGCVGATFAWLWFGMAILRRLTARERPDRPQGAPRRRPAAPGGRSR